MLSLIGGQPMPNVIAALQYRPDRVVCFATERTRSEFEGLRAVLAKHGILAEVRIVDPYDIGKIAATIERELSEESGGDWIANITGATKTMALALYRLAQARGIPSVYVVTELGKIYEYPPRGGQEDRDISVRLGVEDYIGAHNLSVNFLSDAQDLTAAARFLGRVGIGENAGFMGFLRWALQDGKVSKDGIRVELGRRLSHAQRQILQGLASAGCIRGFAPKGQIEFDVPAVSRKFLEGGWLEVYAHDLLARSGLVDDCRRNVKVRNEQGVENELDVVATKNGKIALLSCKTGNMTRSRKYRGDEVKAWIDDTAERARMLGRYSRKFMVSNSTDIPEQSKVRADQLRIRFIGGEDLPRLPDIVAGEMDRLDAEIE